MPADVLHKLSAYRLEAETISTLEFPGFTQMESTIRKIDDQSFACRLFFSKSFPREASWYPAFTHLGLAKKDIPRTLNAGFILLVKFAGACYAVTGGTGHIHLRKAVTVTHQFGVELAKRILSEEELRSLAQRDTGGNVNAIDRHFRGRYSPRNDVNNLRRILKNVRGQLSRDSNPLVKTIGSSIQGTDALSVNGSKSLADILRFLATVHKLWERGKDRIIIPALARLDERAHSPLIAELESALVDAVVAYRADAPQVLFIEGERHAVFSGDTTTWTLHAGRWSQGAESASDVLSHASAYLARFASAGDRMSAFEALKLRIEYDDGTDEDGDLSRFVCGDVVRNNENYFVDHRSWYHANNAYVAALGRQLDNIECIDASDLGLNVWDETVYANEGVFNASHKNLVLLDKRLVKLANETGIEFCDLFGTIRGVAFLIHVKRAHGAALRELFSQGSVSGTFYSESQAFRDKVHAADFSARADVPALTRKHTQALAALKNRQVREFTVVYAVLDTTPSHAVASSVRRTSQLFEGTLSAFAKVDLLNHCQQLRGMGYGVALTRIRPIPTAAPRKSPVTRAR